MSFSWSQLFEFTATLVILYLVLTNADHFAAIVNSLSSGYSASVKTLQGR